MKIHENLQLLFTFFIVLEILNKNIFIETNNTINVLGVNSYKFSWLLDRIWDERTYKRTIVPHIKKFKTEKYDFNLIDLPGSFKQKKIWAKVFH